MKKVLGVVFIALALLTVLTSCAKDKSSEQFSKVMDNMSIESQDSVANGKDGKFIVSGKATIVHKAGAVITAILIDKDIVVMIDIHYTDLILSNKIGITTINVSFSNSIMEYSIAFESNDNGGYKAGYTEDELVILISKLSGQDIVDMLKTKNIIFTLE